MNLIDKRRAAWRSTQASRAHRSIPFVQTANKSTAAEKGKGKRVARPEAERKVGKEEEGPVASQAGRRNAAKKESAAEKTANAQGSRPAQRAKTLPARGGGIAATAGDAAGPSSRSGGWKQVPLPAVHQKCIHMRCQILCISHLYIGAKGVADMLACRLNTIHSLDH